MPVVTIQLFAGRPAELRAKMARAVTEALQQSANIPPQATTVIFQEIARENWCEGGVTAAEPGWDTRPR